MFSSSSINSEENSSHASSKIDVATDILVDRPISARKGRVLMLHGWAQNAKVMRMKTKTLTKKLNQAGYDCVFIDGPFVLPMAGCGLMKNHEIKTGGRDTDDEEEMKYRENARAWFLYSEADPTDTTLAQVEETMTFIGVHHSIQLISQILQEGGEAEFCALMAFSHGSVFAHLLSAMTNYCSKNASSDESGSTGTSLSSLAKIRCVIHASGFQAMYNGTLPGDIGGMRFMSDLEVPSLHLIGEKDTSVPPDLSHKLVLKYRSAEVLVHEKGHIIPQKSAQCATVVSFLNKYNTEH